MSDLHAALTALTDKPSVILNGSELRIAYERIRQTLAAHPAPSSPADWPRLDESPASSAQMIQWHAPETWAAILAALADQARDRLAAIDTPAPGESVHQALLDEVARLKAENAALRGEA